MNSLQKFSEAARKALIAITILSTLTVAAAAQRVQPQQQGKMYGEPGFVARVDDDQMSRAGRCAGRRSIAFGGRVSRIAAHRPALPFRRAGRDAAQHHRCRRRSVR